MNASFERDELVQVQITVEHEGAGIPAWFMTLSAGNSGTYAARTMDQGGYNLDYQVYKEAPPSTAVLMAPPQALTLDNVISAGDFSAAAAVVERVTYSLYFSLLSGQFSAGGEYGDTVTLTLYEGDYTDSGTYVPVDSVDLLVMGRMAELIDIYADREPDNRSLDLTSDLIDKRIALIHERSNSPLGYEVTIRSANLAADASASVPFMAHETDADRLDYSLAYDGVPVTLWTGGTALITNSLGITGSEWLTKELTLSYTGDPGLAHGEYEDILTVIITSK